ncbi:hypothetical protein D3874_12805 [Oleomonas cavernae]|uniref:PNPLA domain-containing protein n=1 Tax=Oleomonas cavernae TaxID=2320859 RepID=A0A418WCS6_9PROT|nr:hypothetical protein D3874_12805 [Oleomonas cavernae]
MQASARRGRPLIWRVRRKPRVEEPSLADSPVIELMRARQAAGSKPGARQDAYRLAVVIEGGGMRGVVAGGMVSALEVLGLLDTIDAVYGTSAGACAGAYLLAGQALDGTRIFYEDINNKAFLRFGRALIGRPVMNTDYLIDNVIGEIRALDAERVIASPIPLVMMATDVATGAAVGLRGFRNRAAVLNSLRASTRLPMVGGRPVPGADGRLLVDGALSAPIPVALAAAEGATHLLVLSTRPDVSGLDGGPSRSWFARLLARRVSPAVAAAYLARPQLYLKLAASLLDAHLPGPGNPHLAVIRPARPLREIGKVERRRVRLLRGASAGWSAIATLFGDETDSPFADLPPLRLRQRMRMGIPLYGRRRQE